MRGLLLIPLEDSIPNRRSESSHSHNLPKNTVKQHVIWRPENHRRRCRECHLATVYQCKKCNVALHPKCFDDYHIRNIF